MRQNESGTRSSSLTLGWKQKLLIVVVATLAIVGVGASPAFAEGSWSSSVSRGSVGSFSSRWWNDNQRDANVSGVSFKKCSLTNGLGVSKMNVTLYRDNGIFPDHNHGTVANSCNGTYSNWKSGLPAGSFKWKLASVKLSSGPTTTGYYVNIPSLTTKY